MLDVAPGKVWTGLEGEGEYGASERCGRGSTTVMLGALVLADIGGHLQ